MHRHRTPLSSRLPAVVALILACAIAGPSAAPAAPTDTGPATAASAWDLARPGPGELLSREGDRVVPLPLVRMQVDLEVTGILVHGEVSQEFRNDRAEVLEATYVFPLPEGAAVNALEMRVGDRRIVAMVKERGEARQIYEQARDEGRKAALLEQGRPNLFRASVAAINPEETVEVRLEFVEQAAYADGEFSVTFPLVYTPRYLPAGETAVDAAEGADARTDGAAPQPVLPRAGVRVRLQPGLPLDSIDSPSHRIALDRMNAGAVVTLAGGTVPADRDFVLRWRIRRAAEPQAALFVEDRDDGRDALAMILPPTTEPVAESDAGLPTETLFIVDVSGSMDGPSIAQAREALAAALGKLRPDDTFNLLKFNDRYEAFRESFLPADVESVAAATAWIQDLRATGGTEILPALVHGLQMREAALVDRGEARARVRGWTGGKSEAVEDRPDGRRVQDRRQQTQPAATVRTLQHLQLEGAPHQLGPRPVRVTRSVDRCSRGAWALDGHPARAQFIGGGDGRLPRGGAGRGAAARRDEVLSPAHGRGTRAPRNWAQAAAGSACQPGRSPRRGHRGPACENGRSGSGCHRSAAQG